MGDIRRALCGLVAIALALGLAPGVASARVIIGFGYGLPWVAPPIYYPPRVYYPPPVVYAPPVMIAPGYAPPPVVYTPPGFVPPTRTQIYGAPVGQSCNAGAYRCPMEQPSARGAACYCRGNDGQRMWGAVN